MTTLKQRIAELELENLRLKSELEHQNVSDKSNHHSERNHLVVLVAHMANLLGWKAGVGKHEAVQDQNWKPAWTSIVRIDLPTGQVSWHIHESQKVLLEGLPEYDGDWDGCTTAQKYVRVQDAFKKFAKQYLKEK